MNTQIRKLSVRFPMASPYILCLLSIITFTSSLSSSTSTPNAITLPLSPLFTKHPDPFETLKSVASASVTRAHHLKRHKSQLNSPLIKTPIHPKSYGGYSIDLKFGTPPQTFPLVLDTGSSLLWLPCSSRYLCSKCNHFSNTDPTKIPKFIPKNSSSSKFIGCKNPKCAWVFGPEVQSRCQDCKPNANNCSQACPAYTIQYGMGSTAGFLLSENLNFPGKTVPDFLFGCSIISIYQPAGIAGFGRGLESVPSQMGLKRFSYCLASHRFDDSPKSSDLVLHGAPYGDTKKTRGVSYTPFRKNPSSRNNAFSTYYYVTLRKVIVGGKRVRIPSRLLEPDSEGNGGSILDSGSTFTFMERPVLDLVAQEFEKQVNHTRARDAEKQSGLSPCFDVSGNKTTSFPELTFQFKGGAKMTLPLANYFSLVGKSDVACLTIASDDVAGPGLAAGPAVILGNYQQQDFYVEYDLENERFGFRSQSCKTSL